MKIVYTYRRNKLNYLLWGLFILLLLIIFRLWQLSRFSGWKEEDVLKFENESIFIEQNGKTILHHPEPEKIEEIRIFDDAAFLTPVESLKPPFENNRIRLFANHSRPFAQLHTKNHVSNLSNRWIKMQKIHNFRDLGGYETENGQVVWGKIFRCGYPGKASQQDIDTIRSLGIRTIVDLRDDGEVKRNPGLFLEGIETLHIQVADRQMVSSFDVGFRRKRLLQSFTDNYKTMILDRGAKALGSVLEIISDPANLPILFHCTAGKDRTGVLAALILLHLGVKKEDILKDYALSNKHARYLIENTKRTLKIPRYLGFHVGQFMPLISANPYTLNETLKYLENRYGDLQTYLVEEASVKQENLELLKQNLIQNY